MAETVLKDLLEVESLIGWHENFVDQIHPVCVVVVGEVVVELCDFLLCDLFVPAVCLERGQASEQQGVEDDPETPDVDFLIVLKCLFLVSDVRGSDFLWD